MLGTIINCVLVVVGVLIGLLFRGKISQRFVSAITSALALSVLGVGVSSAIRTEDPLCVIVCMVVGTAIGVALKIEERLDRLGDFLQKKLVKDGSNSRFTEAFVSTSLLFCVGSMAVMGSIEAGINHNYSILISKGVIDGVTSISFTATMGIGTLFSIFPLFLYQGLITLLAAWVGPLLSPEIITEISAVGGTILVGIALNMLEFPKRIPSGNMLPAIFLPLLYLPVYQFLSSLF